MNILKTKSPVNSILFILKSHEGLNKDYPEVLEIIESYLETEKNEIINAWIDGGVNTNAYPDFAEKYYNETFEK